MSHFTVLVITDNPEDVESAMAPFQENNAGDCPEQFLTFTSVQEEVERDWTSEDLHNGYMDKGQFYWPHNTYELETTYGKNWVEYVDKVSLRLNQVYSSFDKMVEDYHGYRSVNPDTGEYGYWENPNAKWDWYQIGGRWTGFFKMKWPTLPGLEGFTKAEISNFLKLYQTDRDKFIFVTSRYKGKEESIRASIKDLNETSGRLGEPGVFGNAPKQGHADQALKKDIDFEGMLEDAEREANEQFDKIETALSGINYLEDKPLTWRQVLNQFPNLSIDEQRKVYSQQPVVQALKKANLSLFMECEVEAFHLHEDSSRAKYVADRRCGAFSTFAVLYDGVWYERGDMGWFGVVFDEKSKYDWSAQFIDIIDSLPDTACLTVVDCHI